MRDFFLADDLSGALDAAAAFHQAGRRVTIALSAESAWDDAGGESDVLGITTETRNATPSEAAARVRAVLDQARARGARLIYKKIDSTLRGPIAAELAALTAADPARRILFCPANPAVGRTVQDGVLFVRGVRVAETEFGRDPAWPVRESAVRALLGAAVDERVIVADATTQADLAAAVARMEQNATPWVAVGAGALAREVAAAWFGVGAHVSWSPASLYECGVASEAPALFVGGSAHPLNREQAEQLASVAGFTLHEIAVGNPSASAQSAVAGVRARGAASIVIQRERADRAAALYAIVSAAQTVIEQAAVARVFVTGGETAFALARALGIERLIFVGEIEPGLSLSTAATRAGPMLWAVKPGGFGDRETWCRAHAVWQGAGKK